MSVRRRIAPRRLAPDDTADLTEHLDELRNRLFVCLAALSLSFVLAYLVHGRLIHMLESKLPPEHRKLVTFGITEPFMTSFKVSFVAALALALPIIMWQLWAFMAPALPGGVVRGTRWLALSAAVLMAAGVTFAYRLALPAAATFLTTYDSDLFTIQVRAGDYINFAVMVLVSVGLVFELPIFILGLVRVGVLSSAKLRRTRRMGYFLMAAVAVALPGVDPVTTLFEMVPLWILFESSIWISVLFERRWASGVMADTAA